MQSRKVERKRVMEGLTRKDILDSAVTVLIEEGIRKLTMDRVATGAGIAKGTVYLYFKNKQELLESVSAYCFEPLEAEFQSIADTKCDPIGKLEKYALETLRHAEKNKPLFTELRNVIFSAMDQHVGDKSSWYWAMIDLFASTIDEGVTAGRIRPVNSVKVAALFLNSINTLMAHRILSTATESVEEDVRELLELFTGGLAI